MMPASTSSMSLTALLLVVAAASTSVLASDKALSVPAAIQVPSGNQVHVKYYGVGLQYYYYNGSAWVNYNATANLYRKRHGDVVGQHYYIAHPDAKGGQPTWETYHVESLVTAKSLVAVTVDPKSITWNLLQATSESGSKKLLGAVTYLQRIYSKGGLPPSSSEGAKIGDIHTTPYSILYVFYVKG